jgi:hypothetical protein
MAGRVVGYLEYGNALDDLDRLVSMSSPEELNAINEIIRERDEFTIYSNLSNQLPTNGASGSVSGQESVGTRRGLAWVIALARVEFGAIVAGFTPHPNPYMFVNPRAYDFRQSIELLLDGALTHREALMQDRDFRDVAEVGGPIMETLAYSRRVRIAGKMLEGAMKAGTASYSPSQVAELDRYHKDLNKVHDVLVGQIRQYVAAQVQHTDETTIREFLDACTVQLDAERRELAAGTATVRRYPEPSQYP